MINLQSMFRRAQLLLAAGAIAMALIVPTAVPTDAQGRLGARTVVSGPRTGFIGGSHTGLIDTSSARPAPALSVPLEGFPAEQKHSVMPGHDAENGSKWPGGPAPAKPAVVPITPYVSPQPVLPSRSAGAVMIANEGERDLQFQVRPEGGQWKSFTVRAGQSMDIGCNGCSATSFEFFMQTQDRGAVNYRLNSNSQYALGWDGNRSLWNLYIR
jgi:hypothetical protein